MTSGQITNMTESDNKTFLTIDAGESTNLSGTCVDLSGTAIDKASLLTLTVSIFEEETGGIINSRDEQDIKDANGGLVSDPATYIFRMGPDDNAIINAGTEENELEQHIVRITWTWDDGVETRTGIAVYRIRVRRLYNTSAGFSTVDPVPLANYAAVRAYTGTAAFVHVQTSGNSKGLFYYFPSGAGSEDNGIQVGNYRRFWDNQYIDPDWWDDLDKDGVAITGDEQKIVSAIAAAVTEGIKLIRGERGTEYETTRRIQVAAADMTYENLSVKRADVVSTTLTVAAADSDTTFTVASTSGFRVGDQVELVVGTDEDDKTPSSTYTTISSIGSGTITTSGAFPYAVNSPATWPIGTTLVRVHGLFTFSGSTGYVKFRNCKFDGNKSSNNKTWAWTVNPTMTEGDLDATYWEDCEFINTPGENIRSPTNGYADNCVFDGLNGSFIHFVNDVYPITEEGFFITNLRGTDVCSQAAASGHAEGAITFSSNVAKVFMDGIRLKTGGGAVFGNLGDQDDGQISLVNFDVEGFNTFCNGSFTSDHICSGIRIADGRIKDCGYINFGGEDIRQQKNFERIELENLTIVGNTNIDLRNCGYIRVSNVDMTFTDGATITNPKTYQGAFVLQDFDRLDISGLKIVGPETYDANLDLGLMFFLTGEVKRKDGGGSDIDVNFPQQVRMDNIYIKNFRKGFGCRHSNVNFPWDVPCADWKINNLTVIGYPNTTHTPDDTIAWDAWLPPGAISTNVFVYPQVSTNNDYYPLVVSGLDGASPVLASQYGGFLRNWGIMGPSTRTLRIGGTSTGRSNYNVQVRDGISYSTASVHNKDVTRNDVEDPVIISDTLLPALTSPAKPYIAQDYENEDQY